jgi:ABC-type uncharacterized transport system permease subunit
MEQHRIKVEGWSASNINIVVAVIQSRTGQIHLAIEGVEPTIPNLINVRQMLDEVIKKIDEQLPTIVQESVTKMLK